MKHKHAELIKAWAEGAEIEYYSPYGWLYIKKPNWLENSEYRLKLNPKPDIVEKRVLFKIDNNNGLTAVSDFKLTYCGETGKLKSAEVI